jgi:hypothetical protein
MQSTLAPRNLASVTRKAEPKRHTGYVLLGQCQPAETHAGPTARYLWRQESVPKPLQKSVRTT